MILRKRKRQSWRLNNSSKTFLNQWEFMGFHKPIFMILCDIKTWKHKFTWSSRKLKNLYTWMHQEPCNIKDWRFSFVGIFWVCQIWWGHRSTSKKSKFSKIGKLTDIAGCCFVLYNPATLYPWDVQFYRICFFSDYIVIHFHSYLFIFKCFTYSW